MNYMNSLTKNNRLEIVARYLEVFKTTGNIPEQARMLEDIYYISKFIEDGELQKKDKDRR